MLLLRQIKHLGCSGLCHSLRVVRPRESGDVEFSHAEVQLWLKACSCLGSCYCNGPSRQHVSIFDSLQHSAGHVACGWRAWDFLTFSLSGSKGSNPLLPMQSSLIKRQKQINKTRAGSPEASKHFGVCCYTLLQPHESNCAAEQGNRSGRSLDPREGPGPVDLCQHEPSPR
jgi:hypothetical protein